MPCIGAGIVAAFTAIGFGSAFAGVAITVAVGAAVGGITAAITGGDIMKGMLFGAVGAVAVVGLAGGVAGLGGYGAVGGGAIEAGTGLQAVGQTLMGGLKSGLGFGGGALPAGEKTVAASSGFWSSAGGGAAISGIGPAVSGLMSEDAPDHALEQMSSDERIAKMKAESAAEVARIKAAAGSGGGGGGGGEGRNYDWEAEQAELDRQLSRDSLSSKEGIAKGERDAVIKKASMEIAESRAGREAEIKGAADRRDRAIKGLTSGSVRGNSKGSRSNRTLSDIRNDAAGAANAGVPAGNVPVPVPQGGAPVPQPVPQPGV